MAPAGWATHTTPVDSVGVVEIRRTLTPDDPTSPGSVVTIGAYDGVHLGHRQVIAEVCRIAAERGLRSAVVTFDRHPASVVRPESAPLLLTDLDQKLEQLSTTGIDTTVVVPFDDARALETAKDFVTDVLIGGLGMKAVVVGEDFHFGYQRLGNVALLRSMGVEHGFEVLGLGLVGLDGTPARDHEQVSSTFIRRALARGDLRQANAMLGRPYEVRGEVGPTDFVTSDAPVCKVYVNPTILLPGHGRYACWFEDMHGSRIGTVVLVEPTAGGSDVAGSTILALPLGTGLDLGEGSVRVSFVSFLENHFSDEASRVPSERLGELADSAREALG